MNRFLTRLSRWRGRSFVQREFESRGFMIPTRYQKLVGGACSSDTRRDLDYYWDEVAREYICSAGQANSITRSFPDVPCYRSKFLDDLALKRTTQLGAVSLHPCLNEFLIKRRNNPELDSEIVKKLEAEKQQEIRQYSFRADQWTGEKRDVGPIFSALMQEKGFKKRKRAFVKVSPSGLVFGGIAELGGRPYCISVPFVFFVASNLDITESFQLGFQRFIPGFWYYYRFDSKESALLGFRAHVEMIDIMSNSFFFDEDRRD